MSFVSEFKEFASKGNVVDLAVGVIIGAAFAKIVDSLVKDLIMPVVGRVFGGLDFSNYFLVLAPPPPNYNGPMTYEALTKAGVPLFAYGNFITVRAQLRDPGLHHLHDGQADQPAAPDRSRRCRRRRKTSSCCARSATRCAAEPAARRARRRRPLA